MKINNPRIKENLKLSRQDEIDAINMIANMFFKDITDESGTAIGTQYTPYLEETAKVNAIVRYFLDGVEVEDGEDVYDEVMNDECICKLVFGCFCNLSKIMEQVYDIVEYRKAENLARIQNEANSIITYKILELIEKEQEKNGKEIEATENLNNWIDEQRKYQEELNKVIPIEKQKEFIEKFNVDDLTQSIYSQIADSDLHKRNKEVVELTRENREKENKIIELENKLKQSEQKENVKNVLADKKK